MTTTAARTQEGEVPHEEEGRLHVIPMKTGTGTMAVKKLPLITQQLLLEVGMTVPLSLPKLLIDHRRRRRSHRRRGSHSSRGVRVTQTTAGLGGASGGSEGAAAVEATALLFLSHHLHQPESAPFVPAPLRDRNGAVVAVETPPSNRHHHYCSHHRHYYRHFFQPTTNHGGESSAGTTGQRPPPPRRLRRRLRRCIPTAVAAAAANALISVGIFIIFDLLV
mmetsp:Transcript_12482/g.25387  ORF Transcript_12482/g.25387 Transcript_12482/m.25387 type:complete len:221 (+) Transcript_12482:319-981(+)